MTREVEVWPDFLDSVQLFYQIRTQWRVGGMGPTGLDYNVLFHKMDRMNLEPEDYEQMEADIRTLETAALAEINKKD